MNSFKTTCVVLVLAGVLYGVYVTLNAPPPSHNAGKSSASADVQPPAIDFGPASTPPSLSMPGSAPTVTLPPATSPDGLPPGNVPAAFVTSDQAPRAELPPLVPPTASAPSDAPPLVSAPPEATASTPPTTPPSYPATPSPALEAHKLKQAMLAAERHVQDGKFRSALAELSPLASNRNLTTEQRTQLFAWLDALAGKVIYSREHLLKDPHRVSGKNENLYAIAAEHKVDVQLLLNVNAGAVTDPVLLVPGTDIKVIPGPFRAEVSLAANELTLYVGQLYAGRFNFTVGDERPKPGTYQVQDKRRDKTYYGRDGRQFAAGDPGNPYGGCWIDLGSEVSLHGSPQSSVSSLGCLSFTPQDANDLFAILSMQSEVVIQP